METHKPNPTVGVKKGCLPSDFTFVFFMMFGIHCSLETKETADNVHLLTSFLRNHGAVRPTGTASPACGGRCPPASPPSPTRGSPGRGLLLLRCSSSKAQSSVLFYSSLYSSVYFMNSIPYGCQSYLPFSHF